MDLQAYLNAPIPRKTALAVVIGQATSSILITIVATHRLSETVKAQDKSLKIYSETTEFLMEHASPETLDELNQRLDYWRVIQGMPAEAVREDGE